MLTCRQVAEVCSTEMDRPLSLSERFALHSHLLMCSGCRNYREQLSLLRQAMRFYGQGQAASTDDPEPEPPAPPPPP
jgi:predicted anti-sigma-YlaC factor YlaD